MKKQLLVLLVLSIIFFNGCWHNRKVQRVPRSQAENTQMASNTPTSDGQKDTMLSFFDDQDAMEQAETLVFDDSDIDYPALAFDEQTSFAVADDGGRKVENETCVVYFDYDSTSPRKDQQTTVAQLQGKIDQWLTQGYQVAFCGHACRYSPKGTDTYNLVLSENRAHSLVSLCSSNSGKVKIFGVGNEQPLVIDDMTKEGQAPNRRVEIYPIAA